MTSVRALLEPRAVAIVGATEASRQGRATYENLRLQGYQGEVYLVNPRYSSLFGEPCYPSVLAVPESIDVVVSAIGAGRSVDVLEESAQAGAKGAVVFADGFLESGPDGALRQSRVQSVAESAGMAVCGPNCMGLIDVAHCLPLWMGTLNRPVPAGEIAVVAQSGTIAIALLNNDRGLRFSHVISSGNEAVTSSAAYLEHLVEDPKVSIVVNHLETLHEPHRYLRAVARAAELGKPIVVLKTGRSELAGRVIAGHTGQVAGSDLVTRAVLREHGVVLVETLDELVETTYLLAHPRRPRGPRFGFVSISGGYSGLAADLAVQAGLECPPTVARPPGGASEGAAPEGGTAEAPLPNFVDAWGNGDMADLPAVLDAFGRAPNVDTVAVVFHLSSDPVTGTPEFGRTMTRWVAEAAARHPKPFVWITPSARPGDPLAMRTLEEADVPCLLGLRDGIAALASVAAYRRPAAPAANQGGRPRSRAAEILTEHQGKDWLEERGLPVTRRTLARTEAAATAAARRIGFPLVLKKQVRGVEHKTGRGYVRTGIWNEDAARQAYRELMALDADHLPAEAVEGVLIEEQVPVGLELMVSLVADAAFGPIVYLGYGGLTSEQSAQRAIRLAPVDLEGARSMLTDLGLPPLLARVWGERQAEVADRIAAVVERLSSLGTGEADDRPTLVEINPLMVTLDGRRVVAVDALVQLAASPNPGRS